MFAAIALFLSVALLTPVAPTCVDSDFEPNLTEWTGPANYTLYGRPDALVALGELFEEVEADGLYPVVLSGFRSYDQQAALYAEDPIWREPPGCSQHQTGTAFDIGWIGYRLDNSPYDAELYEALEALGSEYGFEVPYDGTGDIPAEPWHINYILEEVEILGVELRSFDPERVIRNTIRWTPLAKRVDEPHLTIPLILAVIAQESRGINGQTSTDGWASVGLMQVIPRPHLGTPTQLMDPAYSVWVGTRMLSETIEEAAERGYDDPIRYGLAAYNCGWKEHLGVVMFKFCGEHGGLNYADRVIEYWCPYFDSGEGCGIQPTVQLRDDLEDTSGRDRRVANRIRRPSFSWHPQ